MREISPNELRNIVDDYQRFLPQWKRETDTTLIRVDGPVLQAIVWETSGADYRPMNYVQVLAAPRKRGRVDFFGERLKGRPRVATLRSHARDLPNMFEAMRLEFRPSLLEPFFAEDVLDLCERVAVPTSYQAHALAAFNAYFGRKEQAIAWCKRFNELVDATAYPWQSWDHEQRAFLDLLEQWLEAGSQREHLESVTLCELEKRSQR